MAATTDLALSCSGGPLDGSMVAYTVPNSWHYVVYECRVTRRGPLHTYAGHRSGLTANVFYVGTRTPRAGVDFAPKPSTQSPT